MNITIDAAILQFDNALRSILVPKKRAATRANPADSYPTTHLNSHETRLVQGLMRVNHSGEVCAQALYHGQACTAKNKSIVMQMQHAALEEIDHLSWCESRLHDLEATPSKLNFIWYVGSFFLGAVAGICGDTISLGFVAETEHQVGNHLEKHLQRLPKKDQQSYAILSTMRQDEMQHAKSAKQAGGIELPSFIRKCMRCIAKVMTYSSYYF